MTKIWQVNTSLGAREAIATCGLRYCIDIGGRLMCPILTLQMDDLHHNIIMSFFIFITTQAGNRTECPGWRKPGEQ